MRSSRLKPMGNNMKNAVILAIAMIIFMAESTFASSITTQRVYSAYGFIKGSTTLNLSGQMNNAAMSSIMKGNTMVIYNNLDSYLVFPTLFPMTRNGFGLKSGSKNFSVNSKNGKFKWTEKNIAPYFSFVTGNEKIKPYKAKFKSKGVLPVFKLPELKSKKLTIIDDLCAAQGLGYLGSLTFTPERRGNNYGFSHNGGGRVVAKVTVDSKGKINAQCMLSSEVAYPAFIETENIITNKYDYSLEIIGDGDVDASYVGPDQVEFRATRNKDKFRYFLYNGIRITNDFFVLELEDNTDVTAVFGTYNFSVIVSGDGYVNYEFVGPDEVVVTAVPGEEPFYSFEWNGNVSQENPLRFTLTSDTELLATFKKNLNPPAGDTYMVIDLSGGTNTTSFAISYLDDVPDGGWTDEYKTTKMVLRKVKAGKFIMGSPEEEYSRGYNEDQHEVTLTKDFYVGVFETTQSQYELIAGYNPANYKGSMRPVECVSYEMIRGSEKGAGWPANSEVDATSFLGVLRAKTHKAFDLPTEAQWEYACRAETITALNNGSNITNNYEDGNMNKLGRYIANHSDGKGGYIQHTTVGSYLPNAWGLYDMHGNVHEWCLDWFQNRLGKDPVTDPKGAASFTNRVIRGGGFQTFAWACRSAYRKDIHVGESTSSYWSQGFRLVLESESTLTNYTYHLSYIGDGEVDNGYVGPNQAEFRVTENKDKFRYYSYDGIKVTDDYMLLNLTKDTDVTAVFGNYDLSVNVSGSGSVSYEFTGQDEVVVTAIPGEEPFDSFEWNGNVSQDNPLRFTLTSDTEILATFKKNLNPPAGDTYMVIDLSGGTNTTSFAISYLDDVPDGGWTDEYKTTKMVLRKVKAGKFTMGTADNNYAGSGYNDRIIQHEVTLTKDFYIGIFETTQKQYELVAGNNPSYYKGDDRPVEYVSYDMIRGSKKGAGWPANGEVDATSFLGKLRSKTSFDFDLPTDAQWEYACRAGTTNDFNNGTDLTNNVEDENLNKLGRYNGDRNDGKGGYSEHTTVGSYLPNAWGLYDMHGNVFEWCLDWYQLSPGTDPVTDPKGATEGSKRLMRGGAFTNSPAGCDSVSWACTEPFEVSYLDGFRVVLESESTSTNIYNYKYSLKIVGDGDVDHGYAGTNKAEFRVTENKDKFRYYSYDGIKVTDDYMLLDLTKDTEVTAVFGAYDFSLSVIGNGSAKYEFTGADEVKIKVTSGALRFRYYTVNREKYTDSEISLKLIEDTEVTAVFGTYNLSVNVSGNGSVNYEFIGQDEVVVTAVPGLEPFYSFALNGNISQENPLRFTLTSDTELIVTFKKNISPAKKTYMVVDLSGGPNAASYSISYLDNVPQGGWSDEYKTSKMVFRLVPAGVFFMGSPETELGHIAYEKQHQVTLTRPFYVGVFEVTQRQYALVMGANSSEYIGTTRPVDSVSFAMIRGKNKGYGWPSNNDVDEDSFLGKFRSRTNEIFDLPTEAQWEYACRAKTGTALNNGSDLEGSQKDSTLDLLGRYKGNGGTERDLNGNYMAHVKVGSYLPNAWGLYDMHGNVSEAILDWDGSYNGGPEVDPVGCTTRTSHKNRGGSWCHPAYGCRSADRGSYYTDGSTGFRLVLVQ